MGGPGGGTACRVIAIDRGPGSSRAVVTCAKSRPTWPWRVTVALSGNVIWGTGCGSNGMRLTIEPLR
ncbi:hypothetical protein I545_1522 [Mycobacterium kansasii 662]|uniref:Uncharacterized protein n=1 Tax=Mycobacterium kansasii 662 TaxID=1299326 RepID=X7ZS12_MYCKA|nr:hypothetical protein I545_1522 [Mycobacterium kansasii 662]